MWERRHRCLGVKHKHGSIGGKKQHPANFVDNRKIDGIEFCLAKQIPNRSSEEPKSQIGDREFMHNFFRQSFTIIKGRDPKALLIRKKIIAIIELVRDVAVDNVLGGSDCDPDHFTSVSRL